jgi:hypothetical protein
MTSDSFSGSEARVSVALPGFSKPREEEGLHTTNLQFTSKALGYLQCGLLYY